jgi:UrcA family protein
MTIRTLLGASFAGAALALSAGAAAGAQSPHAASDFTFTVARENLDSRADARVVYRRLTQEARRYCGRFAAEAACVEDVVSTVVARVGHPALDAVHARERGGEARRYNVSTRPGG